MIVFTCGLCGCVVSSDEVPCDLEGGGCPLGDPGYTRDSGSGPKGENSRSEVEGGAPQSGGVSRIAQSPIEDPTP